MANVTYTSTEVLAANVPAVETDVAAEAITAGQAIFLDTADTQLYKADASSVASGARPGSGMDFGVALSSGSAGQTVCWAKRKGDTITYSAATFVAGMFYVVSDTAGGIMPVTDLSSTDSSLLIGYATSTTVLYLLPQRTGVELA